MLQLKYDDLQVLEALKIVPEYIPTEAFPFVCTVLNIVSLRQAPLTIEESAKGLLDLYYAAMPEERSKDLAPEATDAQVATDSVLTTGATVPCEDSATDTALPKDTNNDQKAPDTTPTLEVTTPQQGSKRVLTDAMKQKLKIISRSSHASATQMMTQ